MKRNIKGIRKTQGKYTLKKTRIKEQDYVITAEDIEVMARQQEGNKILDAIDGLASILREENELEIAK